MSEKRLRIRGIYHLTLLISYQVILTPLSANPTKWSNTLKQFVGKLPTNILSVFVHFVKLVLKGLIDKQQFPWQKIN